MAPAKLSGLAQTLGRLAPDGQAAPDGDLLARFVATRDESAFAELVRRYGPMVFAVCRRVTGSHHLAEDAFQAAFVVLATKAATVRPAAALPAWLHTVATRTALRARTVSDRRRRREAPVETLPDAVGCTCAKADDLDLAAVVDEEVAKLPDALRVVVVLCELEGCSRRDAAARLGVPEGTVSSRLASARKALAARLKSRGLALGAAGLSAVLGRSAAASVPAGLSARALASAMSPGVVPAPVAALSSGVLRVMFAQKLKTVLPLVVLAFGAMACAALAGNHENPVPPPGPKAAVVVAPPPRAATRQFPEGPNRILVRREPGRGGERSLCLLDPDGKSEKEIGEKTSKLSVVGVKLSPDGKRFAARVYGNQKPGDDPDEPYLYVRGWDEKDPGTYLGVSAHCYVWSRDGTELAGTQFEEPPPEKVPSEATHFIVNVRTKETTAVKLPSDHVIAGWSPDGRFFLTEHRGEKPKPFSRLFLMNRDGTEHKALTAENERALCGRLSPDGRRVLYAVVTSPPEKPVRATRHDMVVLDITTGKATKVGDVPLNVQLLEFCWSPDGKQIAYLWRTIAQGDPATEDVLGKETESHLIVCDPDGRNQKTVLSEKGTGIGVALSELDWR